MRSKIVTFAKNYKAPLAATIVFFVIVVILIFSRTIEYLALTEFLGKNSSEQSYGALLSKDSSYELKKGDLGQSTPSDQQNTQQTNISPFTVSPTPTPTQDSNNIGNTDGGGATGTNPGGDTGTNPSNEPDVPEPTLPFSAIVAQIKLDKKEKYCPVTTMQPATESTCTVMYTFVAEIKVENGPGNISSYWHGGPPQFSETLNFYAADDTFVYKQIVLACSTPMKFGIQYVIQQPNASQSTWLMQDHFC